MEIIEEVKKYISKKFAQDIEADQIPNDLDLNATGILTSVSTVQLIAWAGKTYGIPINSVQINPAQLRTPEGITGFITAHREN